MNAIFSSRATAMRVPASIAAKARVTELRRDGREIIDFTLGEPDFDTPPHVVEAAATAMRAGATRYTASNGTLALREAVAAKFLRENGIACEPSRIIVGCGAKQLIDVAFAATLDEGDEVIVPAPYWVSYPDMIELHGGRPVVVACPERDGFRLTPDRLAAAITPRTRWLILNSPNNPSGAVYSAAELAALAEVLDRHRSVWLLTDEIYEHFVFGNRCAVSLAALDPGVGLRTLTVNGVSKTYAMTGWRIGYAAGPAPLVTMMTKIASQATTCPPSVSQAAALAALAGDQTFVREASRTYEERSRRMTERLKSAAGFRCREPEGAFYLFPSVDGLIGRLTPAGKTLTSDVDVAAFLLEHAGVAVVEGSAYGLPSYLRLSFATPLDQIENGCDRIASAVAELR